MSLCIRSRAAHRQVAFGTALLLGTALGGVPAYAQNATWVGGGNNIDVASNWSPAVVPTGRATFAATGNATPILVNIPMTLGGIDFAANAQTYTIINEDGTLTIGTVGQAGIVNSSTHDQSLLNHGRLTFVQDGVIVRGAAGFTLTNIATGTGTSLTFKNPRRDRGPARP